MSDANKGLSGRKRRVGAMRGLVSLAVIFFVALSAQASARTIRCQGDTLKFFPNGPEVEYEVDFYVSYDVGKGSKVKNLKVSQPSVVCDPVAKIYSDETKIIMYCPEGDNWEIDRLSGNFLTITRFAKPQGEGSEERQGFTIEGSCKQVKQKF